MLKPIKVFAEEIALRRLKISQRKGEFVRLALHAEGHTNKFCLDPDDGKIEQPLLPKSDVAIDRRPARAVRRQRLIGNSDSECAARGRISFTNFKCSIAPEAGKATTNVVSPSLKGQRMLSSLVTTTEDWPLCRAPSGMVHSTFAPLFKRRSFAHYFPLPRLRLEGSWRKHG